MTEYCLNDNPIITNTHDTKIVSIKYLREASTLKSFMKANKTDLSRTKATKKYQPNKVAKEEYNNALPK